MLVGVFIVGMLTGEYWCEDRSPWWGPPTDPNSTCSGHSWEADHPGEFPLDAAAVTIPIWRWVVALLIFELHVTSCRLYHRQGEQPL